MTEAQAARGRITVRSLLLGERIDTQGLERSDVLASLPLTFRVGANGMASLFRFGVKPSSSHFMIWPASRCLARAL